MWKKMPIDIFLIFCHDILAMILFRILTKSKGVHVLVFLATEQKPCNFHDKPRHRQFRRHITLQCRYRDVAKTTCGNSSK